MAHGAGYWSTYLTLKAFNSLLSLSSGITLKRPSYNRRPITRHSGSMIPIIPVSEGRPILSCNIRQIIRITDFMCYEMYNGFYLNDCRKVKQDFRELNSTQRKLKTIQIKTEWWTFDALASPEHCHVPL